MEEKKKRDDNRLTFPRKYLVGDALSAKWIRFATAGEGTQEEGIPEGFATLSFQAQESFKRSRAHAKLSRYTSGQGRTLSRTCRRARRRERMREEEGGWKWREEDEKEEEGGGRGSVRIHPSPFWVKPYFSSK